MVTSLSAIHAARANTLESGLIYRHGVKMHSYHLVSPNNWQMTCPLS